MKNTYPLGQRCQRRLAWRPLRPKWAGSSYRLLCFCCSSMLPDLRAPPPIALVALVVGRREEACDKALLMSYDALPSSLSLLAASDVTSSRQAPKSFENWKNFSQCCSPSLYLCSRSFACTVPRTLGRSCFFGMPLNARGHVFYLPKHKYGSRPTCYHQPVEFLQLFINLQNSLLELLPYLDQEVKTRLQK